MAAVPEPTRLSAGAGSTEIALLDDTIGRHFDEMADRFPECPALVVAHQDIRWSYREYREEIERLATGLLALGVTKGDRVGIWAPNCVEWCLTQFATAKIGAIMVCVNLRTVCTSWSTPSTGPV